MTDETKIERELEHIREILERDRKSAHEYRERVGRELEAQGARLGNLEEFTAEIKGGRKLLVRILAGLGLIATFVAAITGLHGKL